jgi:hypothetical protein
VRIQIAGIKATVPWSELTRPKKGFVIFCGASLVAGLLSVSVIIMNLYVDTQVPVALSPFVDVIKTGGDMVIVKGTWTRHGATAGWPWQTPCKPRRSTAIGLKNNVSKLAPR